jgi:predicted dehydrogenase
MAIKNIRVGLIGAGGNMRSRHIPGFKKLQGVELAAVANRTVASGRKIAKEFGVEKVCADWMEILEDETIDAVCIGTWPYMHETLAVGALDHGKHVLCEARMAMNSAEAHRMLKASMDYPRQVAQIVPSPRTFAIDRTIMDMMGAGYIGDLVAVDARVTTGSGFPKYGSPMHWRYERDFSGNNIMAMGILYEAMMRWVGTAKSVQALGQSVVKHRVGADGSRVQMTIPDHVDCICEMEQGGIMRYSISSALGHTPKSIDCQIFGTEGTISVQEEHGGSLEVFAGKRDDKGLKPVRIAKAKKGFWRVEEEFINAIRGKEEVKFTDFTTATRYMEWTDAVTLSIRRGEKVYLPLADRD